MAPQHEGNSARHREALEAFNRRDMDAVVRPYHHNVVVTDHAQHTTMKSVDGVRSWNQAWLDGFSDGMVEDVSCIDAGEWTIARFTARGTNDGRFGTFEATHRRVELDLCDVARWADGMVVEQHFYYDIYGMLAQLGHVPPLAPSG